MGAQGLHGGHDRHAREQRAANEDQWEPASRVAPGDGRARVAWCPRRRSPAAATLLEDLARLTHLKAWSGR
jgi:hypothetical protein